MPTTMRTRIGFLCEDVNWKLVEEYAREEKIGVNKIPPIENSSIFFWSDRNDFGPMVGIV